MKKVNERACVNRLVKALQKNSPQVYIHVDRDSGSERHTSSSWDFLVAWDKNVIFCEAKTENGKLTEWQEFTRALVHATGGVFKIIRFWDEGETFTVSPFGASFTTPKMRTENIELQDLL